MQTYMIPSISSMHKVELSTDTPWMQPPYTTEESKQNKTSSSLADIKVEKNTEGKPPYSYATLIKYAIEQSPGNKLTLSQIYQWVIDHYPYYGSAGSGWKNSIRHNLSLNKSFVRIPRPVNEPGKGSYWTVDQYAQQNNSKLKLSSRCKRSSVDGYSRSLSTDAGQARNYPYCSHPYNAYGYPSYHRHQNDSWLSNRTSNVTYSLPQSTMDQLKSYDSIYGPRTAYPNLFYPHRQSCPDLSYPETSVLSNYQQQSDLYAYSNLSSPALSTSHMSSPNDNYASPSLIMTNHSSPIEDPLNSPYYSPASYLDISESLGSSCSSSPLQTRGGDSPRFNESHCIKNQHESNMASTASYDFDY